jgi:hypothetical protein
MIDRWREDWNHAVRSLDRWHEDWNCSARRFDPVFRRSKRTRQDETLRQSGNRTNDYADS